MINGLKSAAAHMQTALDLLDDIDAPPELGAQLDFTICRTRSVLGRMEAQRLLATDQTSKSHELEALDD